MSGISRYVLAGGTALALLALTIWSVLATPVAPEGQTVSTVSRAEAGAAPAVPAPRQVSGWFQPGGDLALVTIVSGPLARCPAWPQLVRVRDASGMLMWVTQQDAGPAAAELLDTEGRLPVDRSPVCGEVQP